MLVILLVHMTSYIYRQNLEEIMHTEMPARYKINLVEHLSTLSDNAYFAIDT